MDKHNKSRRQFLKTTAYVAPAILTLKAAPALAAGGSGPPRVHCDNGFNGSDCNPPGLEGNLNAAHVGQDDT
jgi:nitrous oxide reductase